MNKVKGVLVNHGGRFLFHCPGCKGTHMFNLKPGKNLETGGDIPVWQWNQDLIKPTFNPSLLIQDDDDKTVCHLFVTDGRIQYLTDCQHELSGKTVDMLDW